MRSSSIIVVAAALLSCCAARATAAWPDAGVDALIESSCIHCHDSDTETRLNFAVLGRDLSDPDVFRQWVNVFDRVHDGEMPPASEPQPDAKQLKETLSTLRSELREANRAVQDRQGRVPSRRLTRLEYEYTIRDLLLIEEDLAKALPEESDSGGFDTVGAAQRISPIHLRSYLQAADQALEAAINLGPRPRPGPRLVDYLNSPYVNMWHDRPLRNGGSVTRKLDDAVALFIDADYLMRSDACGLRIPVPGLYRITAEAYSYQARTPVTLKLIHTSELRGGAQLLGAFDLLPGQTRSVQVTAFLRPGDYFYPSVADLDPENGVFAARDADGNRTGAANYDGEGIAVKPARVEGPLFDTWPPVRTRQLFAGMELVASPDGRGYQANLTRPPIEHVRDVVSRIAPLAFRRPPMEDEIESFVALAEPPLEEGRRFTDALRVPLRSMLSSPQLLFFGGEPGQLDDFALASRLSYFLWKSLPDEALFQLARDGVLSEPAVLAAQVDRMLDDEKSTRFVRDFLGQWLRLYDINATTPDENLCPEFDDVLNQAIMRESELFFTDLVRDNLSVRNLIDSDYTFLNRRLAEHYGIEGITGQEFRRVTLPVDSPRGGILTQASVLKVTANGTVTSPVVRGNFVLTNLLGTPPDPPPPDAGSIEPDTRGTTTIRETLAAHRTIEACASCHNEIDPPGFALESFDPIGRFRTTYRIPDGRTFDNFYLPGFREGLPVDPSGVTVDGTEFSGTTEFKHYLLDKIEQIARNFISRIIVYSTGGEIQFADRDEVEAILERTGEDDFPVRTIIHEVVQSRLFREK